MLKIFANLSHHSNDVESDLFDEIVDNLFYVVILSWELLEIIEFDVVLVEMHEIRTFII